jgi:hypothetical protein
MIKCKNNIYAYNEWVEMGQTKKETRKKVTRKNRVVSVAPAATSGKTNLLSLILVTNEADLTVS